MITLGRHSYLSDHFKNHYNQKAVVGNYTSIAAEVMLIPENANHYVGNSTFPFAQHCGHKNYPGIVVDNNPLRIGSDVWIGHGATIIGQLEIGHGAVIGAKAVITKNVEPFTVVVGTNRVIRHRFSRYRTNCLLLWRWWDMNHEWIMDNIHLPTEQFLHNLGEARESESID